MRPGKQHIPLIISAIALCVIVYAVYPFYQYYVDPDATGYLTIIRRYVTGDIARAVNGYWSPWSCWLAAGLVKSTQLSIMAAAVAVNVVGAIGFLFITHSFLAFFKIENKLVWLVDLVLTVFLSYAVYAQLCDDLWECFLLLSTVRIILSDKFVAKPWLWVATGVLGSLAYFAKAYAFPFFILNTFCCTFFVVEASRRENRALWFRICVVSITVMIACSFPWIWALHEKYGEWITSTAGKLNLSWYVVGHPFYKEGILHLIPPPYPDSPLYWEDPYLANGPAPNAFNSLAIWKLQLVRIPYNLLKMVTSMNQLSALFIPVSLLIVCIFFSKKIRSYFPAKVYILGISFLLFPIAFVLMNFEARYLWYMLPVSLVVSAMAMQHLFWKFNHRVPLATLVIFAISYLYWPVTDLKQMFNVGKKDFQLAANLRQHKAIGRFTSNATPGLEQQGINRVAYFSGGSYYYIPYEDITHDQLLSEIRRYGIEYYIHFYGSAGAAYYFNDENGKPFPLVLQDDALRVRIFKIIQRDPLPGSRVIIP